MSEVASKMATQAGASFSAGLRVEREPLVDEVRPPKVRRIRQLALQSSISTR